MNESIIKTDKLTKMFKAFTAVDAISLDVKKGEIFGFLGPNGAGKSTTIRMLTTLLTPTSGTATVSGFDIRTQQDRVRTKIGLVAEKIILYDYLTAMENLLFFGRLNHMPTELIRERADRWIERLGMSEWKNAQVGTYSTGMKQRINIVRALLTEPEIMFLDEPTLGLDPQTTHMIRTFIQELNAKGTTIILTTHDMVEAEALSSRVAIIDHGKIVAMDTVPELKKMVTDVENPSLGDVFLQVTGKEIRDTAGKMASAGGGRHGPGGPRPVKRVR